MASARPLDASAAARNRRVLVVDDNPAIHDDFRKILRPRTDGDLDALDQQLFGGGPTTDASFDLDSAMQGKDGLERIEGALKDGRPYAVVFIDMRMPPGWDGAETCSRILAADPNVHVVICTAYSDHSLDELVQAAGAGDRLLVLKKPFDSIEVRQIVHAMTQKWNLLDDKQRHLHDLERAVAERTAQLQRANEQLQTEMQERLRVQHDLQHAHRLEALGRLTAGLGHEINNPLAYLSANLDYLSTEMLALARELPAGRLDDVRLAIDEMRDGVQRIGVVVRGVKLFARSEGEDQTSADLHGVVQTTVAMLDHELRHRGVVRCELAKTPLVRGDPQKLEQVVVNLLLNAMQALPADRHDGSIVVRLRHHDATVTLEVEDSGQGIEPENLGRVFDPFFTTQTVGEGTGLGLSICHSIVTSVGGRIDVRSRPGAGTTIQVDLPVADGAAANAPAEDDASSVEIPEEPEAHILVIDDDAKVLSGLRRLLRPHAVTLCKSAREGLEEYQRGDFDLVLCDVMMPGESGLVVFKELSALGIEHARRLVFMTGGAFTPQEAKFLKAETVPYLDKPLSRAAIDALLDARLAHRPQVLPREGG